MATPPPVPERQGHPYLTYDMIREIPAALEETLRRIRPEAVELAAKLEGRRPLYLTGCGSAYFAALLGGQPLGLPPASLDASALPAFELARYPPPLGPAAAVLAVSHSGVTKATVDALRRGRTAGAYCVGVTHHEGRPLGEAAHRTLLAGNGPDRSKCHTKCYVAGALAVALVALEVARTAAPRSERVAAVDEGLDDLPRHAEAVLRALDGPCAEAAREALDRDHLYLAGPGPNVVTALEAALKVKETSFVPAEGMETEELLHGPWNAFGPRSLVVLVAPQGPGHNRSVDLARAAKGVGAMTLAVVTEGDEVLPPLVDRAFPLPPVDEQVSPYVAILPLYLLAYHGCVARGHNPDELHYLSPPYWEARNVIFPPGTH